MTLAYFDCFSGAAGDMIVASLIHAGADPSELTKRLTGLGVSGYEVSANPIQKQGFDAIKFDVTLTDQQNQQHRHLRHIREILDAADLPQPVRGRALAIFTRLAEAEAKVHGTTIEKVHFHEVGAIDAIVDVVGACLALDMLGVTRVACSPIPTGSGTVKCDHGIMPVPAPATAELLKRVPLAQTQETGELTTPTGAAILSALAESFGPPPAMTIERIGYGAGTRDGKTRPNVLRVLLGAPQSAAAALEGTTQDVVTLLETNLDDATPEQIAHAIDALLTAGVLDAYAQPIQMKKGRPAVLLAALCEPARTAEFERIIFRETPTLGIRRRDCPRTVLPRRIETVETPLGPVKMKVREIGGEEFASPEYDDCHEIAIAKGSPLHEVMTAANIAWHNRKSR